MNKTIKNILFTFLAALPFSALISLLSPGEFLPGWLAAVPISWLSFFLLIYAWQLGEKNKMLGWMMVIAFVLRLGVGISLHKGLPVHGYPEEAQYHGYVFRDAHERDIAAWNLAQSDKPLWVSFKNEIAADQYGGLLSISAAIYRYLSPDAHRPFLVLILGACASALALPFLWLAIKQRWNLKIANLAAWIVVLYPDAVLFGSSEMREPFILAFACIAFWAVITWRGRIKQRTLILAASTFGMLLFSSRVAIAILVFLMIWLVLEEFLPLYKGKKWILWVIFGIGAILAVYLSTGWFIENAAFDFKMAEMNSGWVHKIVEDSGNENFRAPFLTVYGLAQPVLPAAIAEPTIWIWKTIIIPRALGWYLIAPFLLYGMFTVFKAEKGKERTILLWLSGFLLLWLIVSSLRAGGDLWDNPRYRSNFLPWYALLAAWAVNWAREHKDRWLYRWVLVEVIFLGFFTNWYFSRYYLIWSRLPFWQTVMWILVLSAAVLVGGFVRDRIEAKKR